MSELDETRREGARHQSLFRDVNERIDEVSDELGAPELSVLCECARTECAELIQLTQKEYEAVRRIPTHFVLKPAHVQPELERVVEARDRYEVVEKFGEAGKLAVRLDPRRRPEDTPVPSDSRS